MFVINLSKSNNGSYIFLLDIIFSIIWVMSVWLLILKPICVNEISWIPCFKELQYSTHLGPLHNLRMYQEYGQIYFKHFVKNDLESNVILAVSPWGTYL